MQRILMQLKCINTFLKMNFCFVHAFNFCKVWTGALYMFSNSIGKLFTEIPCLDYWKSVNELTKQFIGCSGRLGYQEHVCICSNNIIWFKRHLHTNAISQFSVWYCSPFYEATGGLRNYWLKLLGNCGTSFIVLWIRYNTERAEGTLPSLQN